jgi:hypothetical protein
VAVRAVVYGSAECAAVCDSARGSVRQCAAVRQCMCGGAAVYGGASSNVWQSHLYLIMSIFIIKLLLKGINLIALY